MSLPAHSAPPISRKDLLVLIDRLQKSPADRVRILGEAGIVAAGAVFGSLGAGALAAVAGATTIPVLTSGAAMLGLSFTLATPIGWVIGAGAVGGVLAYGVGRILRNGGVAEGRKRELLTVYRERLQDLERRERLTQIVESDRLMFLAALRELVDKRVIEPHQAFRLLESVESGAMPLSKAYGLMQGLLSARP